MLCGASPSRLVPRLFYFGWGQVACKMLKIEPFVNGFSRWWVAGVEVSQPAVLHLQPAVFRRRSTGLRAGSGPLLHLHSLLQPCTSSQSLTPSLNLQTSSQQSWDTTTGGSAPPSTAWLSAGFPQTSLSTSELLLSSPLTVNSRTWLSNIKNILTTKSDRTYQTFGPIWSEFLHNFCQCSNCSFL